MLAYLDNQLRIRVQGVVSSKLIFVVVLIDNNIESKTGMLYKINRQPIALSIRRRRLMLWGYFVVHVTPTENQVRLEMKMGFSCASLIPKMF